VKKGGIKYSPKFKFPGVLEVIKAEGKATEAQVARAYRVPLVTLAASNECYTSRLTHHSAHITAPSAGTPALATGRRWSIL